MSKPLRFSHPLVVQRKPGGAGLVAGDVPLKVKSAGVRSTHSPELRPAGRRAVPSARRCLQGSGVATWSVRSEKGVGAPATAAPLIQGVPEGNPCILGEGAIGREILGP